MTKPTVSILSPDFRYVNAASTSVAKTFARARRELRAKADAEAKRLADEAANKAKVAQIFQRRREGK